MKFKLIVVCLGMIFLLLNGCVGVEVKDNAPSVTKVGEEKVDKNDSDVKEDSEKVANEKTEALDPEVYDALAVKNEVTKETIPNIMANEVDDKVADLVSPSENRDAFLEKFGSDPWVAIKNSFVVTALQRAMGADFEEFKLAFQVGSPAVVFKVPLDNTEEGNMDALIFSGCAPSSCGINSGAVIYIPKNELGLSSTVYAAWQTPANITIYNNPPDDVKEILLYSLLKGF